MMCGLEAYAEATIDSLGVELAAKVLFHDSLSTSRR